VRLPRGTTQTTCPNEFVEYGLNPLTFAEARFIIVSHAFPAPHPSTVMFRAVPDAPTVQGIGRYGRATNKTANTTKIAKMTPKLAPRRPKTLNEPIPVKIEAPLA
jgi:hypothetical protein